MVASLFRGVPAERFAEVRSLFLRLRDEFGVPLEVINDGDVTALAGAMSLEDNAVLGIAMGSSEAAGYVNPAGQILPWLSELAFAPVDYSPDAPCDEWSGDQGVGASYFSQQCVFRLAPRAGIEIPAGITDAERLMFVQKLLEAGHPGAAQIWESMGILPGLCPGPLRRFLRRPPHPDPRPLHLGPRRQPDPRTCAARSAARIPRSGRPAAGPAPRREKPPGGPVDCRRQPARTDTITQPSLEFRCIFTFPPLKFSSPTASRSKQALARTTHLAVAAHQDDIEIMAAAPILACFQQPDRWFTGVVVTDGRGSPRDDLYKNYSDEEMRLVRFKEQKKAAVVGEFAAQMLLDYPSKMVKDGAEIKPVEDLTALFLAARPQVSTPTTWPTNTTPTSPSRSKPSPPCAACRSKRAPEKVYGCEVWRDLDWLVDTRQGAAGCERA